MQKEELTIPKGTLKFVTHDYIVYKRDYLYNNLDHEIELMKAGKEYVESGKAKQDKLNFEAFKKQINKI